MWKLFKKELTLNVPPLFFAFALFGTMVLIPNYTYIVASGYVVLQIFNYLMIANQNLSIQFTSMLPTKRNDAVAATSLVVVLFELLNIAVVALCLFPAKLIHPEGNVVGLDANLTLLGVSLLCFATFNLVFLPKYFKTSYKIGFPVLWGLFAFLGVYAVCETLIQVFPSVTVALDSYNPQYIWERAAVLATGFVLYCILTFVAVKIACKKFEKVNL